MGSQRVCVAAHSALDIPSDPRATAHTPQTAVVPNSVSPATQHSRWAHPTPGECRPPSRTGSACAAPRWPRPPRHAQRIGSEWRGDGFGVKSAEGQGSLVTRNVGKEGLRQMQRERYDDAWLERDACTQPIAHGAVPADQGPVHDPPTALSATRTLANAASRRSRRARRSRSAAACCDAALVAAAAPFSVRAAMDRRSASSSARFASSAAATAVDAGAPPAPLPPHGVATAGDPFEPCGFCDAVLPCGAPRASIVAPTAVPAHPSPPCDVSGAAAALASDAPSPTPPRPLSCTGWDADSVAPVRDHTSLRRLLGGGVAWTGTTAGTPTAKLFPPPCFFALRTQT